MKTLSIALTVAMCFAATAHAQEKVTPTKTWKGDVADEALQNAVPQVVASQKTLDGLWASWKQAGNAPKVDFTKEIVVIATSRGSIINLSMMKKDDNLNVLGFGTRDLRPGFRFTMASVARQGIATVNGKSIPKE